MEFTEKNKLLRNRAFWVRIKRHACLNEDMAQWNMIIKLKYYSVVSNEVREKLPLFNRLD